MIGKKEEKMFEGYTICEKYSNLIKGLDIADAFEHVSLFKLIEDQDIEKFKTQLSSLDFSMLKDHFFNSLIKFTGYVISEGLTSNAEDLQGLQTFLNVLEKNKITSNELKELDGYLLCLKYIDLIRGVSICVFESSLFKLIEDQDIENFKLQLNKVHFVDMKKCFFRNLATFAGYVISEGSSPNVELLQDLRNFLGHIEKLEVTNMELKELDGYPLCFKYITLMRDLDVCISLEYASLFKLIEDEDIEKFKLKLDRVEYTKLFENIEYFVQVVIDEKPLSNKEELSKLKLFIQSKESSLRKEDFQEKEMSLRLKENDVLVEEQKKKIEVLEGIVEEFKKYKDVYHSLERRNNELVKKCHLLEEENLKLKSKVEELSSLKKEKGTFKLRLDGKN